MALGIRWPKYWSFSFSISSSSEFSGLISFRNDWFTLLAVQGTLKSLLQYHSMKASIFQCSAFFVVQFTPLYMTPGKTIALTIWTFVSQVMSVLFNMLSGFVIAFLPRNRCLNFVTIVTVCSGFGAQENNSVTASTFSHLFGTKWWDQRVSPDGSVVKNLSANAGDIRDVSSIPGSGRYPGGGHATHSSILAWRITWTEDRIASTIQSHGLVGYSPWGPKESDTTEVT